MKGRVLGRFEEKEDLTQIMENAVEFLGAGECSSKISGHTFRVRSMLIFSSSIQLLGQSCREGGQLSLTRGRHNYIGKRERGTKEVKAR